MIKAAYDALADEFALAGALIKARGDAGLTQEQVARAMGTTQAVVARLESGRVMPSTRTLQRFAKATGMRLRISFEPESRKRTRRTGAPAHRRWPWQTPCDRQHLKATPRNRRAARNQRGRPSVTSAPPSPP